MDQLTADAAPNFPLVSWAAIQATMRNVWDRPWYQAVTPPPAQSVPSFGLAYPQTWHYRCHCKANAMVQRHPCEDAAGYLYIGQCKRCEAVIWAYRQLNKA